MTHQRSNVRNAGFSLPVLHVLQPVTVLCSFQPPERLSCPCTAKDEIESAHFRMKSSCGAVQRCRWICLLHVEERLTKPGSGKLVSVQVVGGARKDFAKGLVFAFHSWVFFLLKQHRIGSCSLPTFVASRTGKLPVRVCLHRFGA